MELGKTSTFRMGLGALALIVATAALGLALLASGPKVPEIPVSVPKIQQATEQEQEMEEAWENLVDAIRRRDQKEALRIAEWLDEQHNLKTHITAVVRDWCAHSSQEWDFCKEENDETK